MKNTIEKIQDAVFRYYRIAGRTVIKYSGDPRPATYPYITGDGFRKFADHVYDKAHRSVDAAAVKENDRVFVGDSLIREFLAEVHPKIMGRYVLITHNGDAEVDSEVLSLAGDKVIKWYGINVAVKDPRVVPIPLGIENKHYYVCGIPGVFRRVIAKAYPKRARIFYGFTVSTNSAERQPALDAMKRNPLAETLSSWRGFEPYLHHLAKFKFVASPPGSSVEGHRTWDALYIGIVPIVKRGITIDSFERNGVPFWAVDSWSELDGLTEADLDRKFDEVMSRKDRSVIYMDYWLDKIRGLKD